MFSKWTLRNSFGKSTYSDSFHFFESGPEKMFYRPSLVLGEITCLVDFGSCHMRFVLPQAIVRRFGTELQTCKEKANIAR